MSSPPAQLSQWLFDHGLSERRVAATDGDLALARQLRAGLRAALVANHDGSLDYTALANAAARLPLRLSGSAFAATQGQPGLQPLEPLLSMPSLQPMTVMSDSR